MDRTGLTSGQVAYQMNVTDGTVRCWTSGRRNISVADLVRFAQVVDHPVEYFLDAQYQISNIAGLRAEVRRLAELVSALMDKLDRLAREGEEGQQSLSS